MNDDEKWMDIALAEAEKARDRDEVPIGAVIVCNGRVVGRGHNQTEALRDSTAHAEMIAITAAESHLGKYLGDCVLYVTVEPCLMCAGAIGWSQIKRVVYGTADIKRGYCTYIKDGKKPFHPKTTVVAGVREEECRKLITDFFVSKRK